MMRNVILTGCSRGIGKVIAQSLSSMYCVIGIDKEVPEHSYCEHFYQCDIGDTKALDLVMRSIEQNVDSLYALVNNAGIFDKTVLEKQNLDVWDKVMAVNVRAPYQMALHYASLLGYSRGHIIHIASTRARMSESGTEAYSASKGALLALTHALAVSLSGKVSVNAISPGWINIDERYVPSEEEHAWHLSGRVGTPTDIARMVTFLLEEEGGFITGSDFVIDGGVSKKMIYP